MPVVDLNWRHGRPDRTSGFRARKTKEKGDNRKVASFFGLSSLVLANPFREPIDSLSCRYLPTPPRARGFLWPLRAANSPLCRCLAAPPRARCLLHSVRARGFIALPLSGRSSSGLLSSALGASPWIHRSAAIYPLPLGLAPVCERPEPVGPSSNPRRAVFSRARGLVSFVRVVGGVGRLSPACASAVKDNRVI